MTRGKETRSVVVTEGADFPADPVQGYWVDYRPGPGAPPEFGHTFCGPHSIPGAWCPNCDKPLLRFLSLDTGDPRLNVQGSPFPALPLLFCWTCNVAQEQFFYRVSGGGAVELLEYGRGGVVTDFPYEDYPAFFPGAVAALAAVTPEEQGRLQRLNLRFETGEGSGAILGRRRDLWAVRHQVGGEPYLTQYLLDLKCPACGAEMPLLASVADDCLDERGLAGDGSGQVLYHLCRYCSVVGVYQATD